MRVPRHGRSHRDISATRHQPQVLSWYSIRSSWCAMSACNRTSTRSDKTAARFAGSPARPAPQNLMSRRTVERSSARSSRRIGASWPRLRYPTLARPRYRRCSFRSRRQISRRRDGLPTVDRSPSSDGGSVDRRRSWSSMSPRAPRGALSRPEMPATSRRSGCRRRSSCSHRIVTASRSRSTQSTCRPASCAG